VNTTTQRVFAEAIALALKDVRVWIGMTVWIAPPLLALIVWTISWLGPTAIDTIPPHYSGSAVKLRRTKLLGGSLRQLEPCSFWPRSLSSSPRRRTPPAP